MIRLSKIQLLPVIDLDPDQFDQFYPFPSTINQRYGRWKKIMEQYGLGALEPIKKGYDYVRTDQIDDVSLLALVRRRMGEEIVPDQEYQDDFIEDHVFSLEGGVILSEGNEIILTPQCCVSLEDYVDWLRIKRTDNFRRLWIGHPWIYYHMKGNDIIFSGLIEEDFEGIWQYYYVNPENNGLNFEGFLEKIKGKELDDLMSRIGIDYHIFQQAQNKLKQEAAIFQNRIKELLSSQGYLNSNRIADILINGSGEFPSYDRSEPEPILPI